MSDFRDLLREMASVYIREKLDDAYDDFIEEVEKYATDIDETFAAALSQQLEAKKKRSIRRFLRRI